MVKEPIKNTLTKGVKLVDWRTEYRSYFGRDDLIQNVKNQILKFFKINDGKEIDKILKTQKEGIKGRGLFELLLKKYNTKEKKQELVEVLYYLCFGESNTNYYHIKNKLKEDNLANLKSTQYEFIELIIKKDIINKIGLTIGNDIRLQIECLEKGHVHDVNINNLLSGTDHYGCPACNNWKNEKITTAMVHEIFNRAKKIGNICSSKIYTKFHYYKIFGKEKIKTLVPIKFSDNWHSDKWTIDIYIIFDVLKNENEDFITKTFYLGVESDGNQHQFSNNGYETWLKLNKRKKNRKSYREWINLRINVDKYKNFLFKGVNKKFLIRIPTYSGQGKIENRIKFLIWCFNRITGMDLGINAEIIDNNNKEIWLEKYEILEKIL